MDGPAAEWKALYETVKQDLEEEKAAHAKTKAELDQLKAAGTKRPAEAAASPPATKQRTSEDAPPPGPPGGGGGIFGSAAGGPVIRNGKFTREEDERMRKLLVEYGQPCKKNQPAVAAFAQAFPDRSQPSWSAHVNAFNLGEYKEWQASNGGAWAGFIGWTHRHTFP